jgi:hypothetical protein
MSANPAPTVLGIVDPPIEFHHLCVALGENSVRSISESDFISTHFSMAKTMVEADETSWTGVFLREQRTYLELFAADSAVEMEKGHSGIGFSTQRLGQVDDLTEQPEKIAPQRIERGLGTRKDADGEAHRYYCLAVQSSEQRGFAAWLMEVHEEYLVSRDIKTSAPRQFDGRAYMSAHDPPEDPHLDDIIEIHLELSPAEQTDLDLLLRGLGFHSSGSHELTTYTFGGFTLSVSERPDPDYRIQKAVCTITHHLTGAHEVIFLGDDAALKAGGNRMLWLFGPRAAQGS